jgi:hypothetical protein
MSGLLFGEYIKIPLDVPEDTINNDVDKTATTTQNHSFLVIRDNPLNNNSLMPLWSNRFIYIKYYKSGGIVRKNRGKRLPVCEF